MLACYTLICKGGERVSNVSNRIAQIVDQTCKGNKSAFARELNITPAFAAQLYSGQREPSDRTISDICRIFHVSEAWLRTGEGEMFVKRTMNQELALMVNDLMSEADESFRKRFFSALLSLPPDFWPELESFLKKLSRDE